MEVGLDANDKHFNLHDKMFIRPEADAVEVGMDSNDKNFKIFLIKCL